MLPAPVEDPFGQAGNRPVADHRRTVAPGSGGACVTPEPDWERLIEAVLTDPERLTLVFQPIVNLENASIAGYEALSRFARPDGVSDAVASTLTPDQWFLGADQIGQGPQLEALVVARCLRLRTSLPLDCFLTFNVSPHLATHPLISDLILQAGPLHPLIVEFTEHRDVADLAPLVQLRDRLTDNGGLLALDDAGSGYSGLQQITLLRPHLIKLDRALVTGIDTDEVKLALAELLGEFAGRIDAWLLAEGVETWAELDAFAAMGVPLVQGFLVGRPAPPWSELDPAIVARIKASGYRVRLRENAASLVEPAWIETDPPQNPAPDGIGLRLDGGRPVAVLVPLDPLTDDPADREAGGHRRVPISLRVGPSDEVIEIAHRILTRPAHTRFHPLVCVDKSGQALGVIRVERVIARLAELKSHP